MTVGILCEKKSAADFFAAALGGLSGTFNGEPYFITWAQGHVYELVDPELMVTKDRYDYYHKWNIDHLPWNPSEFSWKRRVSTSPGAANAVARLARDLPNASEIVIATDVDPSGEGGLIAAEIIEELGLTGKKLSRMYFTDESPKSLQKGFVERKPISSLANFDEYLKADYRSKTDLLTMQQTRIASVLVGSMIVNQGRLKSIDVRLVGDQIAAYEGYKRVPFFQNQFRDENGVVYRNQHEPLFAKASEVPKIYEESRVVLDERSKGFTKPPALLDLASLSSRLAKQGLKAKTMVETYQKMYDSQVLSYPRTEDSTITTEQFNDLLPHVDKIARLVGADPSLLTRRTPRASHVKDKGAHGANRPGFNVPDTLNGLDEKYGTGAKLIYETVARSYLSMLGEDYTYEKQTGHVDKYPQFVGTTNIPQSLGYKAIFDADAKDEIDPDAQPEVGLGTLAKPFVHEGVPKRPQYPNQDWLMNELKRRNIGTAATRVSTYIDVTTPKRGKSKDDVLLVDTPKKTSLGKIGLISYHLLPDTRIGDPEFTKQVFSDMERVAKGEVKADDLLAQFAEIVQHDLKTMSKNAITMRKELKMSEPVEKVTGTFKGEEVSFKKVWGKRDDWDGHEFTDKEIEQLLAGETIEFEAISKAGSPYKAKGGLDYGEFKGNKTFGFVLKFDDPKDSADRVTGTFGGKERSIKRVWGKRDDWPGHEFTDDELEALWAGKTIEFPAKSKAGKDYVAKGSLGESQFNGKTIFGFKLNFDK